MNIYEKLFKRMIIFVVILLFVKIGEGFYGSVADPKISTSIAMSTVNDSNLAQLAYNQTMKMVGHFADLFLLATAVFLLLPLLKHRDDKPTITNEKTDNR